MLRASLLLCLLLLPVFVQHDPFLPKRTDSREWSDQSGEYHLKGRFISVDDGIVFLEDDENHKRSIPLEKLSEQDQKIVQCFQLKPAKAKAEVLLGDVVDVLDGDTIQFKSVFGDTFNVRLADIDAPESSQPFGLDATNEMRSMVLNHGEAVLEWESKDRYGRILGTLIVGEIDVNKAMVEKGLAWNYLKHSSRGELNEVEQSAREQKLGLWGGESPEAPWAYRDRMVAESKAKKVAEDAMRQERAADAADAAADDPFVYVTNSGKKYHRAGCSHLAKSNNAIKLSRARSAYDPCQHCKPPR